MTEFTPQLHSIIRENEYTIISNDLFLSFKREFDGSVVMVGVSVAAGIACLFAGIFIDYKIIILGILLFATPFINTRWKFPLNVSFIHADRKLVYVSHLNVTNEINYPDIEEIYVEGEELSAFVSPLEKGNKEYVFHIYVKEKSGESHKLLRLLSREDQQQEAIELAKAIDSLIIRG